MEPQPHNFQHRVHIMLKTRNLPLGFANAIENALNGGEDIDGVDTEGQGAQLCKALRQKYMGPFTLGNQHGENGIIFRMTYWYPKCLTSTCSNILKLKTGGHNHHLHQSGLNRKEHQKTKSNESQT
jgi:hypothetical protein